MNQSRFEHVACAGSGTLPDAVDVGANGAVEFLYTGTLGAGTTDTLRFTATATAFGEPLSSTAITALGLFRNGFDPNL